MEFTDLPALNASLNSLAAVFLLLGYAFVRRGELQKHRACMLCAFGASLAFLTSYLVYHWQVGSVPFPGQGWIRPVYFSILISHVVLAIVVLPLAVVTLRRAWRGNFDRHRALARWTWPIWMYVSVTGVIIYGMLYHG
ncbi:MAG: DUF420 domain-containing protein [Bryobacterales bacterium]|nr:DUF420 domain-containing protein [Bryobacterales bacterium]